MTLISKFPGTCTACGCRFSAGAKIEWSKGVGARHETLNDCSEAKKARVAANTSTSTVQIDLAPIAEFLRAAQARGLKSPKLRVLAPDGRQELRLALTKTGSAPGSISVVLGGEFVGCIRPTNHTTGQLTKDTNLQNHLLEVAKDPVRAARDYAALMGLCSFCGLQLTDAGSVEVGYGPVCAKHWGLPHHPKGTPVLGTVPGAQGSLLPLARR